MKDSPCNNCERDCPEQGCAEWRRWFVTNWNTNISVAPVKKTKQFWQYEHPDLEGKHDPGKLI